MSNKFNEPWSLQEKIELLINILQVQHHYLQRDLLGFLAQNVRQNPGFSWNEVPLPSGRSVLSCQAVCDALHATPRQQQQQQQSFGHVNPPPPPGGAFTAGQPPPPPPPPQQQQQQQQHQAQTHSQTPSQPLPQQRPFGAAFDSEQPAPPWIQQQQQQQHPRAIQPRPSRSTDSPNPASTNGESLTIMRATGPEFPGDRRRKKRGRPTKEEAEERDRQLAAEGKVYEPKKRPTKKQRASTGTPGPPAAEAPLSPLAQQRQQPQQQLNTPVPLTQEPPEESLSSGQRRSKRRASFTRGESISPTRPAPTYAPDLSEPTGAESPSDRLLPRPTERERERERLPPYLPPGASSPRNPAALEESGPSALP